MALEYKILIKIIYKDLQKDWGYMRTFYHRNREIMEKLGRNVFLFDLSEETRYLLIRLIKRFQPYIWIYELIEKMEFEL
jgi:hypothetical protein